MINYTRIPNPAYELEPIEFKIYCVLARHGERKFPGYETLADSAKVSRATIARALIRMEARGLIRVTRSYGRVNQYDLKYIDFDEETRLTERLVPVSERDYPSPNVRLVPVSERDSNKTPLKNINLKRDQKPNFQFPEGKGSEHGELMREPPSDVLEMLRRNGFGMKPMPK